MDESSKDRYFADLFWLARRIAKLAQASSRWGSDRWDLLEIDLGREVAAAAREGLMCFWRLYEPPLPSESDGDGRTNGVLTGLTGLAIEARGASELGASAVRRRGTLRRSLRDA